MQKGTATLEQLENIYARGVGDERRAKSKNWNKLNPKIDYNRLYGKEQNLRHLDPDMDKVLAWGEFDPPVKNDFTSAKGAFQEKYKINKMGVEFISEKQDNFRDPVRRVRQPKDEQIVDYVQNENQHVTKKKIYNNLVDKDHMEYFQSEYREQMGKNGEGKKWAAIDADPERLHSFHDNVTAAGKPRYLKRPKTATLVMPQELKNQQLEEKIRGAWNNSKINPQLVREQ